MVNMVNMAFSDKLDGTFALLWKTIVFNDHPGNIVPKKCLVVAMETVDQDMSIISK
jgi:hypothetical protein